MADTAEQERKAKAERAKKLLAAQKKKKKAAAAAAGLADSASHAPSSEAGGSPRPSIDERRPTPLTASVIEESAPAADAKPVADPALDAKPTSASEGALVTTDAQPKASPEPAPPEHSDGDAVERVLESGAASAPATPEKKKRKGKAQGKEQQGEREGEKEEERPVLAEAEEHESVAEIRALKGTIDRVTLERVAATQRVTALESTVSSLQTDVGLLAEARTHLARLEEENRGLQTRLESTEARLAELDELRTARDRATAQVAELEEDKAAQDRRVQELVGQVDKARAELEEKDVAAKAQVDEVESRLARQRDREGGLEAEVIRLKQLHAELSKSAQGEAKALEELRKEHEVLRSEHETATSQHQFIVDEHDKLQKAIKEKETTSSRAKKDFESARAASKAAEARASDLQDALAKASAESKSLQGQLAQQTKRAEQAAVQRKGLQEDNEKMMHQLEEISGRVTALTDEKVGLIEDKETGEKAMADLAALRSEHETVQAELQTLRNEAGQHASAQDQLEQSQAVASESEATINSLRKDIQDLQQSVDSLSADLAKARDAASAAKAEERSRLRSLAEFAAMSADDDADTDHLADLIAQKLSAPSANGTAQHVGDPAERDLELSSMAARLRTAETALHEETSRTHTLSRQLTDMQAEVTQAQRDREEALRFVNQGVGSSRSAGSYGALDRRIASPPPVAAVISPRAPVDYDLPPSVRHKRHVSLQALRARMTSRPRDSQRRPSYSRASNSGVSSLKEDDESEREGSATHTLHRVRQRRQYGDDVVFSCPCCTGDLISL